MPPQRKGQGDRLDIDGYLHNAYVITPDGHSIVSGGANGVLSAYDLKGLSKT